MIFCIVSQIDHSLGFFGDGGNIGHKVVPFNGGYNKDTNAKYLASSDETEVISPGASFSHSITIFLPRFTIHKICSGKKVLRGNNVGTWLVFSYNFVPFGNSKSPDFLSHATIFARMDLCSERVSKSWSLIEYI